TFDPAGHVVVAGAGYVRRLVDCDGDGRADTNEAIADMPHSGAMGMCFLDGALYVTGDGGLWRLDDRDADGHFKSPTKLLELDGGEHGAHGVEVGPDGWLYVTCGNGAGVTAAHVTSPSSPVVAPLAGTIVRLTPDGRRVEIVADGFRNAYDFAFHRSGELLTVDSDGERVHHLPWYTPTRLFDVASGERHGWLYGGSSKSWSRPVYFCDNVDRLATFGRGSPTGVATYRHGAFPARYHDGVFSACWTMGRVYFVPLERDGASLRGETEVFLESVGHDGFAPVDLAVGPAGDLYIAIGGRRTRGSVFRVAAKRPSDDVCTMPATDIDRVLEAPQPLSAWSRADWEPSARRLGAVAFESAARDRRRDAAQRVRAIEVVTSQFTGLTDKTADALADDDDAEIVARLAWSLGRRGTNSESISRLVRLTRHDSPVVQRHAWEALAELPAVPADVEVQPDWARGFDSTSRRVRSAAVRLARSNGAASFRQEFPPAWCDAARDDLSVRQRLAMLRVAFPADGQSCDGGGAVDASADEVVRLVRATRDPALRLEAVRLVQLVLGDVKAEENNDELPGYIAAQPDALSAATKASVASALTALLPSDDERLDQEVARALSMLRADSETALAALSRKWSATSPTVQDVHYLMATSQMTGPRSDEVVERIARAFVRLHGKLDAEQARPSRNWPRHVEQAYQAHVAREPRIVEATLLQDEFGHAGHTLYANCFDDAARRRAARLLVARLPRQNDDVDAPNAWTADVVDLVSCLPDNEALPVLRDHWDDIGLSDAVTRVVARAAEPADRPHLIESLGSLNQATISAAASALTSLDLRDGVSTAKSVSAEEFAAALTTLQRLVAETYDTQETAPREAASDQLQALRQLDTLLGQWSNSSKTTPVADGAAAAQALEHWRSWFAARFPGANGLLDDDSAGVSAWYERLEQLDWSVGDADRGRLVFDQRGCQQCHDAAGRLGPELRGVGSRFERRDLLTAIIDPSRDVAPPYRTWSIQTRTGNVLRGMLVYDSPASKLLQTGPNDVVRVVGEDIVREQPSTASLMPSGLLNGLDDRAIADLFAYLQTIN
ncbi:MAG: c-type cytochrome, partial [Planctomycetales bacterium]|nr:c-type cytochrome [Planctomycetales bacterium]